MILSRGYFVRTLHIHIQLHIHTEYDYVFVHCTKTIADTNSYTYMLKIYMKSSTKTTYVERKPQRFEQKSPGLRL